MAWSSRGASWTCGVAEGTNVAVVGSGRVTPPILCVAPARPAWSPTSERCDASRSVTSCGRARPRTDCEKREHIEQG